MIEPNSTALVMPAEMAKAPGGGTPQGEYVPCTAVLVFAPGEMERIRAGLNNHTIVFEA